MNYYGEFPAWIEVQKAKVPFAAVLQTLAFLLLVTVLWLFRLPHPDLEKLQGCRFSRFKFLVVYLD